MARNVVVRATGSYVPERIVRNADFASFLDTSDEWIVERTGIKERRFAAPGESNSDMALKAAKQCLERAGLAAGEVDLIIVPTVTPDTVFPATANWLQGKLGNTTAWSFDLNAGCSGYIYALAVATSLLENGVNKRALVVGSEKMTTLCDFTNREHCVLFGDAASRLRPLASVRRRAGASGREPLAPYQCSQASTSFRFLRGRGRGSSAG